MPLGGYELTDLSSLQRVKGGCRSSQYCTAPVAAVHAMHAAGVMSSANAAVHTTRTFQTVIRTSCAAAAAYAAAAPAQPCTPAAETFAEVPLEVMLARPRFATAAASRARAAA